MVLKHVGSDLHCMDACAYNILSLYVFLLAHTRQITMIAQADRRFWRLGSGGPKAKIRVVGTDPG